jgi:D-glycero-alpha-D-manno-heptose-7-phosphate kinase
LGGGGTDLQSYYSQAGGFIFAMALNKYIYVTAHRPAFLTEVALHGQDAERAAETRLLRHDLVRAALERHGLQDRFEAASIGDIAGGTGLGSSSCFLVGLLLALHALAGRRPDRKALAEEACQLEIDVLRRSIGKQDQYMAAFGGLTTLDIAPDGQVTVSAVSIDPVVEAAFIRQTHIYYTGLRRDASVILNDQNEAMKAEGGAKRVRAEESLNAIKDLGVRIRDAWAQGDHEGFGRMLHEHWVNKKALSSSISWPRIDELYDHVRSQYGVLGGKIIGAGGGGFLMLFCPGDGGALEGFMAEQNMPRLDYGVDRQGALLLDTAS